MRSGGFVCLELSLANINLFQLPEMPRSQMRKVVLNATVHELLFVLLVFVQDEASNSLLLFLLLHMDSEKDIKKYKEY